MTGSVALDVVIGLVFIFLLYSLFASIIQEIIANLLGLRARNLRHALTRMLMDDEDSDEESTDILSRAVADSKQSWQRNISNKREGLLKEFYDQPIIKYLASGRYFSKPSYIHPADFSKAIMEILKERGAKRLIQDGKDAEVALIQKIESALNDRDTTLIGDETRKHLRSLLENAQNDLQKFEANLEEWFNNMMGRASGWYKKTTQFTLFVIGFILAALFNVNTIAITKTLSKDEDARDAMVELASKYIEENEELIALTKEKVKTGNNNNPVASTSLDTVPIDPADKELKNFEIKLDSLLKINAKLQNDIAGANGILGFKPERRLAVKGKSFEGTQMDSVKKTLKANERIIGYRDESNKTLKYVVEFPSNALAKKTSRFYDLKDVKKDNEVIETYAKLDDWRFFRAYFSFWGYLITALAISLGASFWFDLLNKLIRIRNSIPASTITSDERTTTSETVSVKERVG